MTKKTYWIEKETREIVGDYNIVKGNEELYEERTTCVYSPYERAKAQVYATGNRWAIENWNATH